MQQTRGLTRQHNHALKDLFKGAATTILTQAPDDPLYRDYERVTEAGTKPNLAKLTLARKIASTAGHPTAIAPLRRRDFSSEVSIRSYLGPRVPPWRPHR